MRSGTAAGVRARGFGVPAAGKTGTSPRWLVRRLHLRPAVHRVGGLRRQPRPGPGRRALGAAHLDGVHEARLAVSRVSQRPALSRRPTASCPCRSIPNRACRPRPPVRPRQPKFTSPARSRWQPARCTAAAERDARGRLGSARSGQPGGRPPPPHVGAPPPALAARQPPPRGVQPAPPAQTAQKAEKPKEKKGLFRRLLGVFK